MAGMSGSRIRDETASTQAICEALIEGYPEPVLIVGGASGHCVAANSAARLRFGCGDRPFVRWRDLSNLTGAPLAALNMIIQRARSDGKASGEWSLDPGTGEPPTFQVQATRLLFAQEELVQVVVSPLSPVARLHDGRGTGRGAARFALLADASAMLTSTSDYSAALESILQRALQELGDWGVVHVRDADADFQEVAQARRPGLPALSATSLMEASQSLLRLPSEVVFTGISRTDFVGLDAVCSSEDPTFPHSAMSVPISLRSEVLGTLTFYSASPGHRYDANDLALGEELSRRVAHALDAARLLEREQRRRRQLEAVREVATELANELDLSRLLDLIIRRVSQLVNEAPGTLFIWDESAQRLMQRAHHRSFNLPNELSFKLGEGLTGTAARERRTMVVDDYPNWEHAVPTLKDFSSIKSVLATPILYQSRLVGVITLSRRGGEPAFTPGQRELVGIFADHAAIAIENARLFEREQTRRRQIEVIRELSAEITHELDLSRLLQLIWKRAAELVDADRGALFLWDEEAQELRPAVWSDTAESAGRLRLRLGQGAVGIAAKTRKGIVLDDYSHWSESIPPTNAGNPIRSFMAEPVVYKDLLIGSLGTGRSEINRPFTEQDQETLRLFAQHAAIAIENARLFEQEQTRRRQIEAIGEVTAEIARELDLGRVLELTFKRANEMVRGALGWVYLWDELSGVLIPCATSLDEAREINRSTRLGEGATGVAAEKREAVIVNDYQNWEYRLPPVLNEPYATAALAAPILYQDRLIGVITTMRLERDDPFTKDELALLTMFADHAAIAIENARLYQQEQRERQQLEAIRDLTADIIREQELPLVLDLTIQRATSLVHGHTGVVFVWDSEREMLNARALAGFNTDYQRSPLHLGEGITGLVAETRQGMIASNYAQWNHRLDYVLEQVEMQSAMAAPILFKDTLIGVVTIGRTTTEPFVKEDLELLCMFADHAAIAIQNASLYEELSDRASQMKLLVGKVLRAQDEERRRVAYEVHDGLAQVAAATHQHLEAFASGYRPRTESNRRALDAARRTSQETVREARRIIAGLRPTVLDDLGLASAIRQEVDALRADGISVTYEENLGSARLAQELETTLFSIGREALTNIRKHAGANRADVRLTRGLESIEIEIRDWGRGFNPVEAKQQRDAGSRVGLRGMEERVAWLNGQLTLESRKGQGSRVSVVVPISDSTLRRAT